VQFFNRLKTRKTGNEDKIGKAGKRADTSFTMILFFRFFNALLENLERFDVLAVLERF